MNKKLSILLQKIKVMREWTLIAIIIVLSLIIFVAFPRFFSLENIIDILKSNSILGIASIGMMLVILIGGIDVSISSIIAITTVILGHFLLKISDNLILAFLVSCIVGAFFGWLNGYLVVTFNIPPIVVTLGTLNILFGIMIWLTNGNWITNLPKGIEAIGSIRLFHVSVFIVVAILMSLFLKFTFLGRGIYAIGGNREAAIRIGFSVSAITLIVFTLEGFIAGIAAFVHTTIVNQVDPNAFIGFELQVIAVVILGGVSVTGGSGSVLGVVLGVILMGIINNGLILMRIPTFWQKCVVGAIILLTVAIDCINRNAAEARAPKIDVDLTLDKVKEPK